MQWKLSMIVIIALILSQACKPETNWLMELIDEKVHLIGDIACSGNDTAIALDSGNHPRVIYPDNCRGELHYAYKNSSEWHNEVVATRMNIIQYSIALDHEDNPHICYSEITDNTLRYAFKDSSEWHIEIVTNAPSGIMGTSILIDSNKNIHVGFRYKNLGTDRKTILKYALRDKTRWYIEIVDNESEINYDYTDIALDSHDMPHLIYHDDINDSLKYAYKDSSGWYIETIEGDLGGASYGSLAMDSDDKPHISYRDINETDVKYAYKDSSGWHIETVDSEAASRTFLALDSEERPHISYTKNYNIEYGYRDLSGWHIETAHIDGWGIDLALDSENRPHISCISGKEHFYTYLMRITPLTE